MSTFILCIWDVNDIIKPMEVDLESAWEAGQRSPRNSTTAIAVHVAQQIERRFPHSQALRAVSSIEHIVPHMNPLLSSYLSGIAVRVPGAVDHGNTGQGSQNGAISPKDLDDLRARYENLLKTERDKSNARYVALEGTLSNAQGQIALLQTKLQSAEQQRQNAEARLQAAMQQDQEKEKLQQVARDAYETLLVQKETLEMQLRLATQRNSELDHLLSQAEQRAQMIRQHTLNQEEELNEVRDKSDKLARDKANLLKQVRVLEDKIDSLSGRGSGSTPPLPGQPPVIKW